MSSNASGALKRERKREFEKEHNLFLQIYSFTLWITMYCNSKYLNSHTLKPSIHCNALYTFVKCLLFKKIIKKMWMHFNIIQ